MTSLYGRQAGRDAGLESRDKTFPARRDRRQPLHRHRLLVSQEGEGCTSLPQEAGDCFLLSAGGTLC